MNPETQLTVGFDLDMTLIDSRPGIKAAFQALSAETGTFIDADEVVTRLGPPLDTELAYWFPEAEIPAMADRFREIYPTHAIEPTPAMPGAREAIEAVRALGGRAIVVTAKYEPNARLHLDHLGIKPDAVIGWLWAEAKAGALREYNAQVYVGDHVGDVRGARAGRRAVGDGPHRPVPGGRTPRGGRRRGPGGPHGAPGLAGGVRPHAHRVASDGGPSHRVARDGGPTPPPTPARPGRPCAAPRPSGPRPPPRWRSRRP